MNKAPANAIEFFRSNNFIRAKPQKNRTERKNEPEPNRNRRRIREQIPNYDRGDKSLFQSRRDQQRIDHRHVVPNIKRASDQMRNQRRERSDEKRVSLQRSVHGRK